MKRVDLVNKGGFTPGEHLETKQVDVPTPGQDEVVIDVKASAINPVDWKQAELGIVIPETLPTALGCDVAGVVVSASPNHSAMVGKRVLTYLGANKAVRKLDRGAFVAQVAADADVVVELPDDMSFAAAATLPVGALTAELLLNHQESLEDGALVLVWGASSSVGNYAVQLALKRGLKPIAVASGRHRDTLTGLGAFGFVDYTKEDVPATVKEICGDKKLNGALDCIGSGDTFTTCCDLLISNGEAENEKVICTVNGWGMPETPKGVVMKPVDLGAALEDESRAVVKKALPEIVSLATQKVRLVKGPVSAETVHQAFAISKKGVSGEKVIIEWSD